MKSVNNKRHYAKKFRRKCFYGVHCVKTVRIRRFSGAYVLAFELNMEIYSPNIFNQPECEKIRTRKTPNTGSSHAVVIAMIKIVIVHSFGKIIRKKNETYL